MPGRYRFLLRTSNGSTVLSYTAGNLRDLVHLKISEDAEKGTFMINGASNAMHTLGNQLSHVLPFNSDHH